jgi:hypothetical protein
LAVAAALKAKHPIATYKTVEEVVKVESGVDKLDFYEVLLVTGDKKTFDFEIGPDGKIVKTESKDKKKEEKKDK